VATAVGVVQQDVPWRDVGRAVVVVVMARRRLAEAGPQGGGCGRVVGQERLPNVEPERMVVPVGHVGRRPVQHPVGVAGHGRVGRAVAAAVALVVGVVPEAVVLRVATGEGSFERQDRPVGLRHRARRFPNRRDELEGVGSLYLDRREWHVDAGRDESWVVGQQLDDLRRRRSLRRRHAPARLEQRFAEKDKIICNDE